MGLLFYVLSNVSCSPNSIGIVSWYEVDIGCLLQYVNKIIKNNIVNRIDAIEIYFFLFAYLYLMIMYFFVIKDHILFYMIHIVLNVLS